MSSYSGGRIKSLDALRGLCVILMCAHHFLLDLVVFLGAPVWLFTNPVFDVLQSVFAGLFILLSGISSRFSRSNLRRGGKLLAVALALTLVTCLVDWVTAYMWGFPMGVRILFGVLHMLSICMIFYGFFGKWLERLPDWFAPCFYALMVAMTAKLARGVFGTEISWLFPLGFVREDFYTADYFPVFPWIFVFLFGTWLGGKIRQGRMPGFLYTADVPFLSAVGKRALLVYVLHQPLFAGLTLLIGAVFGIL